MLHIVSSVVLAAGLAAGPADSAELRREALMTALRGGGYTVILRHARTDRSFQEQMNPIPTERSLQRNLSDDGFKDAALMGVVFRKHGVKFAEIISSPMFRATETAELAAGKPTTTIDLRAMPATPEQVALVKRAPKSGTNRLLVTHHFVIELHVPGVKIGEFVEGEAAVVRHLADGKVELAGRITMDDWLALANPNHKAAPVATQPASDAQPVAHGGAGYPPSGGSTPTATVPIPDTHAGHLARGYLSAFNSGSADKMKAFMEATMAVDPARPTEERLKSFAKLFDDFGPLTVTKVDSSEAFQIVLVTKGKPGDIRVTVKSSEAQPMRIASVTFAFGAPGGHR